MPYFLYQTSFSSPEEAEQYFQDQKQYEEMCNNLQHKYLLEDLGLRVKVSQRPEVKEYLFLTINPPASLPLNTFMKTIDKMCSKPWIDSYLYVMEQRDEPDIVPVSTKPGVHTHILIHLNRHIKPSMYTRELKNSFRTKLDVDNWQLFNIKNIDDKEQRKIQGYMLNWKDDTDKHQKQYGDDVFRKLNNINRYYAFNYPIQVDLRSTYYDL